MTAIEPKILLITADCATISEGKLNMLGAGWTRISAGPATFSIVVRLEIPWTMTNQDVPWSLSLIDQDGYPYIPSAESGEVILEGEVHVGRPDDVPEGSSLEVPMVVPFHQIPLRPGTLEWQFTIGNVVAKYPFAVVAM